MPSDPGPLVLAFDTSAGHCAAALCRGGLVISARAEQMTRGQAERLFPLIENVLKDGGVAWSDLDRIGVGVGPGNFTGIRISVSAARGLALSLGIPAIGVSTFDAVRQDAPGAAVAVPAPRGQVYLSPAPDEDPRLVATEDAGDALSPPAPDDLVVAMARAAASADPAHCAPPAPLYLRPADAAPPRDAPPEIVDVA